ncbi:MAG: hypothetical protein H2069_03135 [Legionella sp.]|nr:hypothetical protein [Legionella sp.]
MNFVEALVGIVLKRFSITKDLVKLALLEAKLARLSVLPLLVCFGLFILVFFLFWLCSMALIGYLIFHYLPSIGYVLLILFGIHALLLLVIALFLLKNLRGMSFRHTRFHFHTGKKCKPKGNSAN